MPLYRWTNIVATKPLMMLGSRKKVHFEIRAWEDCWIPTIPVRSARPIALVVYPMMLVHDLMTDDPKTWNSDFARKLCRPIRYPYVIMFDHKSRISTRKILLELY